LEEKEEEKEEEKRRRIRGNLAIEISKWYIASH